uniref:Uncharacterized protein n=1 Tax=Globodera rostochiensis TaxID=31243 RepID=A0A914I6A8_GLORO
MSFLDLVSRPPNFRRSYQVNHNSKQLIFHTLPQIWEVARDGTRPQAEDGGKGSKKQRNLFFNGRARECVKTDGRDGRTTIFCSTFFLEDGN